MSDDMKIIKFIDVIKNKDEANKLKLDAAWDKFRIARREERIAHKDYEKLNKVMFMHRLKLEGLDCSGSIDEALEKSYKEAFFAVFRSDKFHDRKVEQLEDSERAVKKIIDEMYGDIENAK